MDSDNKLGIALNDVLGKSRQKYLYPNWPSATVDVIWKGTDKHIILTNTSIKKHLSLKYLRNKDRKLRTLF